MQEADRTSLGELAERVRALEAVGAGSGRARRVATAWPGVDAALGGGLLTSAVHEWVGEPAAAAAGGPREPAWAPRAPLIHLVRQAMAGQAHGGWGVWVGRGCLPYPHGLAGGADHVLARSLWVDPPGDEAGRLWAIDLAARCEAMAVVVADGAGLDMPATRRLQLAAEAGGTLVLLTRPWTQRKTLSAATTRWRVRSAVSDSPWPRWEIELLRCKGSQRGTGTESRNTWLLEGQQSHGQGFVVVPAEPGDRSAPAQVEAAAARQRRA